VNKSHLIFTFNSIWKSTHYWNGCQNLMNFFVYKAEKDEWLVLWWSTFSDNKQSELIAKDCRRRCHLLELSRPKLEDMKGIQLKVYPAHCNPSYAVAYIKAYTICTLHLLRTLGLCFKCKTAEWWDLLKRTSFHPTV
jgi:hypothetical protein